MLKNHISLFLVRNNYGSFLLQLSLVCMRCRTWLESQSLVIYSLLQLNLSSSEEEPSVVGFSVIYSCPHTSNPEMGQRQGKERAMLIRNL